MISLTKNLQFEPFKLNLMKYLQDSMNMVSCNKNMVHTNESLNYIDVVMIDINKQDDIYNI